MTRSAHREIEAINGRAEERDFETFEDLEYAESRPHAWVEYASRAVYYELAALVEHQLHKLARAPWAESQPKLKKITEIKKDVSDLGFDKICKLIYKHYGTRISEVEGWEEVAKIRSVVNDLKHRGGSRHMKTIDWQKEGFPQLRRIEPDQARIAIENVVRFFDALNRGLSVR